MSISRAKVLHMRRNILLLAYYVVCSAIELAHHIITLRILLPYLIKEMLISIFYRRAEHCLLDKTAVSMRQQNYIPRKNIS